jgi:hypothetical protein
MRWTPFTIISGTAAWCGELAARSLRNRDRAVILRD